MCRICIHVCVCLCVCVSVCMFMCVHVCACVCVCVCVCLYVWVHAHISLFHLVCLSKRRALHKFSQLSVCDDCLGDPVVRSPPQLWEGAGIAQWVVCWAHCPA